MEPGTPGWRCNKCGHEGPPEDFSKGKGGGWIPTCKPCTNEHARQWRKKNPESSHGSLRRYHSRPEIRERYLKYDRERKARCRAEKRRAAGLPPPVPRGPALSPEERKARRHHYYQANREASLERGRHWAEAHREQVKTRKAVWYQANKEQIVARRRTRRQTKRGSPS